MTKSIYVQQRITEFLTVPSRHHSPGFTLSKTRTTPRSSKRTWHPNTRPDTRGTYSWHTCCSDTLDTLTHIYLRPGGSDGGTRGILWLTWHFDICGILAWHTTNLTLYFGIFTHLLPLHLTVTQYSDTRGTRTHGILTHLVLWHS